MLLVGEQNMALAAAGCVRPSLKSLKVKTGKNFDQARRRGRLDCYHVTRFLSPIYLGLLLLLLRPFDLFCT